MWKDTFFSFIYSNQYLENAWKIINWHSGNRKELNSGHVISAYVPWDKATAGKLSEEDYWFVTLPVQKNLSTSSFWCKLTSVKGKGSSDCLESGINHTFTQNMQKLKCKSICFLCHTFPVSVPHAQLGLDLYLYYWVEETGSIWISNFMKNLLRDALLKISLGFCCCNFIFLVHI